MAEFSLIAWLKDNASDAPHVSLGIGDDGCCLHFKHDTIWSMDTMVAGVHFLPNADPQALGHKALAVSVSDCVAMGSIPQSVLLSLTIPSYDDSWLKAYFSGFFAYANKYAISLVGGDLSQGPCSMTTTVQGELVSSQPWCRSAAKAGDDIWVTGHIGLAASAVAGLDHVRAKSALHYPEPPVELVKLLSGFIHAAIDISDGFAQDLGHILRASCVGARIKIDCLPWDDNVTYPQKEKRHWQLFGGDDYQICFTAPQSYHDQIVEQSRRVGQKVACVGRCQSEMGLVYMDDEGDQIQMQGHAWEHFT